MEIIKSYAWLIGNARPYKGGHSLPRTTVSANALAANIQAECREAV